MGEDETYRFHLSVGEPDLHPDIVKGAGTENIDNGSAVSLDGAFDLLPNNDITLATVIPHATVSATASGEGNEYYAFTVTAGARGVFDIDGADFDTFISIRNLNGDILASNDDDDSDPGSDAFNSLVDFTFSSGGVYYLVVEQLDEPVIAVGNEYRLHVSLEGQVI